MQNNFLFWNDRPARRIQLIEKALKKDPFLYHKKKNVISSGFNDSNDQDGNNTNQELLFCQDENNKQINDHKNKINFKSSTIENNTQNYLNFLMKEKNLNSKILPTDPGSPLYNLNNKSQKFPYQESFTPNKYRYKYNSANLENYRNNFKNINGSDSYINMNENVLNSEERTINNNYLPRIQILKKTSDITDQNYYDKISRQLILQMNKNYMDYNQNLVNKRYSPNNGNKLHFVKNYKLSLPPGHISNPKYYSLGESRLSSNPIVNPGNRAPIFNHYNNHNHRLKSEFV